MWEELKMNVYTCWYRGNLGYGCRTRGVSWMFVPELGQPDGRVHRNLCLDDLIFKNTFERQIELNLDNELRKFGLFRLLRTLIFPRRKPHTIGGLLFTVS